MGTDDNKEYVPSEEALELLKLLRPIDDDFMRELFRNDLTLAQMVLRIIAGIDDLVLIREETQYDLKRLLDGRSICLDVFGTDSKGTQYDLEIQRDDRGAVPKRARYHSSAMDVEFLKKGQDFEELPETYVIFITENDIFKKGLPVYRIERINTNTGESFSDGEHILYVNGAYVGGDPLGKLMHDFRCSSANDMYYGLIADKTKFLKEFTKGASDVCKLIEDKLEEIAARVEAETEARVKAETEKRVKYDTAKQTILKFLQYGKMNAAGIADVSGTSVDLVYKLAKENNIAIPC